MQLADLWLSNLKAVSIVYYRVSPLKIISGSGYKSQLFTCSEATPSIMDMGSSEPNGSRSATFMRLFSALFYGISSFLIIVVNKIVLTSYK